MKFPLKDRKKRERKFCWKLNFKATVKQHKAYWIMQQKLPNQFLLQTRGSEVGNFLSPSLPTANCLFSIVKKKKLWGFWREELFCFVYFVHYVTLAGLEHNVQTRLALNLQRSVCLCLSAGIKDLCCLCLAQKNIFFKYFKINFFLCSFPFEKLGKPQEVVKLQSRVLKKYLQYNFINFYWQVLIVQNRFNYRIFQCNCVLYHCHCCSSVPLQPALVLFFPKITN